MALAACTPPHLVTPSIPAYLYRDWFVVLRLANLDAQQERASRRRLQGMQMREPVAFLRTDELGTRL